MSPPTAPECKHLTLTRKGNIFIITLNKAPEYVVHLPPITDCPFNNPSNAYQKPSDNILLPRNNPHIPLHTIHAGSQQFRRRNNNKLFLEILVYRTRSRRRRTGPIREYEWLLPDVTYDYGLPISYGSVVDGSYIWRCLSLCIGA